MKVGDYVRTKNKIYKIIDKKFDETILVDLFHIDTGGYLMKNDIIRSSPNIIDLIEVGDYVNGHLIFDIAYAPKKAVYIEDNQNKYGKNLLKETNIKE